MDTITFNTFRYLIVSSPSPSPASKEPQVAINYTIDVAVILNLIIGLGVILLGFDNRNYLRKIHLLPQNIFTKIRSEDLQSDLDIEKHLTRMQETVGSCRAVVAIFTDGTNVPLFPFKYFSIFWEITEDGVTSLKSKYQKVYLDRIRAELKACMEQPNSFRRLSIEDEIDSRCKAFLLSNGIHTVFSRLLGNNEDGFSGILNLQFDSHPDQISEHSLERLDDLFLVLERKIQVALNPDE